MLTNPHLNQQAGCDGTPVITATREAIGRQITVQGYPQAKRETLFGK
jgi:hypothetical protein